MRERLLPALARVVVPSAGANTEMWRQIAVQLVPGTLSCSCARTRTGNAHRRPPAAVNVPTLGDL